MWRSGVLPYDLSSTVTSPVGITEDAEINEIEDGLYAVHFVPKELGVHTVSVRYKDVHIPGKRSSLSLSLSSYSRAYYRNNSQFIRRFAVPIHRRSVERRRSPSRTRRRFGPRTRRTGTAVRVQRVDQRSRPGIVGHIGRRPEQGRNRFQRPQRRFVLRQLCRRRTRFVVGFNIELVLPPHRHPVGICLRVTDTELHIPHHS